MGQTIHINCQKSRIGENNLFPALGSRVTVKACLHILQKHFLHIRQLFKKAGCYPGSLAACAGSILAHIEKCSLNLLLHTVKQVVQQISGVMLWKNRRAGINVKISRENNGSHLFHNINNRRTDRKVSSTLCQKQLFLAVIGSQTGYCILYGCLLITHNCSPYFTKADMLPPIFYIVCRILPA